MKNDDIIFFWNWLKLKMSSKKLHWETALKHKIIWRVKFFNTFYVKRDIEKYMIKYSRKDHTRCNEIWRLWRPLRRILIHICEFNNLQIFFTKQELIEVYNFVDIYLIEYDLSIFFLHIIMILKYLQAHFITHNSLTTVWAKTCIEIC